MSEQKTRVLLVEDDQVDRIAFLRHVEKQGLKYDCKSVGSVTEARAAARSDKFDVVLLDHNLNDGTGFDLLPDFAGTPVIFVTGSESPEVAVQAMKAGASDYLLKDHDRNYLHLMPVAVERALRQQSDREQLAESQELFRQTFSEAPIGKAFIATGGRILRVNRRMCEIFGYTEQEFLNGGFKLIGKISESPDGMEKMFPPAVGKVQSVRSEAASRRKNGEEIWIQMDLAQVPDLHGKAVTYVAQIQDVTAQRKAEEVRGRLEKQLHKSQKMEALGSLAGGVAHEFNNMLGAIIGYTELAHIELGESHPAASKLDQVLKASERAKDIIQQVLTFSRRQELKRELINVQRVAQDTVRLARPSIPEKVEITVDIPANAPPVFGNTVQMQQALTNVINNAWQSMPNQTGRISLTHQLVTLNAELIGRAGQSVPEGRYSVVVITDNGQGMDATTLDRIFEPFFTTKGPGKGNGLGMPVVHGIMKSHDGGVMLQSDPGKGTTVHLYFPVQQAPTAAKSASGKPALPSGSGEHILFVDDESPLCMIGTKILERIGYKVTAFTSAQDALALFKQRPNDFHLVVTDLTMPGLSGIDFADALIKIRPDIPIILATGYIEESIRDQADLLGFREIVLKPMTAANLAEAVKRILGKKS